MGEINIEGMKVPEHVAIILDGNGRWAKSKGTAAGQRNAICREITAMRREARRWSRSARTHGIWELNI